MKIPILKLYYGISNSKIYPPSEDKLERKKKWIRSVQQSLGENEERVIENSFKLVSKEVDNQRKFFNGPVLEYWIIQQQEIYTDDWKQRVKEVKSSARSTLLNELLGFDVIGIRGETIRDRTRTRDFQETQEWSDFLNRVKEEEFDLNGYDFPNIEEFKRIKKKTGYNKAKEILIKRLIENHKKRL